MRRVAKTGGSSTSSDLPVHVFSLTASSSSSSHASPHASKRSLNWRTQQMSSASPPVLWNNNSSNHSASSSCGTIPFGGSGKGLYENKHEEQDDNELMAAKLAQLRRSMFKIGAVVIVFGAVFGLGVAFERFLAVQLKNEIQLERQTAKQRDELLLDQEKLLLQLTKTRRGASHNPESDSLYRHMELLSKELATKTHQLRGEEERRIEAESEVKEAWGSYELTASQKVAGDKNLRQDLSNLFRRMTTEGFGNAPHYVEVHLRVPTGTESYEDDFLTIELASVTQMPFSVFFFLNQVEAGLWKDIPFHLNDEHTLMTDLSSKLESVVHKTHSNKLMDILSAADKHNPYEKMMSAGLGHLPFVEYDESFPHVAYTLGYTVDNGKTQRPGPSFYINKVNNSLEHAGKPCFGKILIGKDVVDRIGRIDAGSGDKVFSQRVHIVSAQVLSRLDEAVGGREYIEQIQSKTREEI